MLKDDDGSEFTSEFSEDCHESEASFDFALLREYCNHHRTLVTIRTKVTNAIKGKEKRVAVDRIRQEGKKLPEGKMPTPSKEDKKEVFLTYPELFTCAKELTTGIDVDDKNIEGWVKKSHIAPWVTNTKGIGYKSIGYLLGITGDPNNYPHPRMMVKTLGVAPRDAYYDKKYDKNLVPKLRRSITLYWCLDSALKQKNKYREVYLTEKRRQVELYPEFASKTYDPVTATGAKVGADRKARLRAATVLIYDLWSNWTGRSLT